ncbi:MAG: N-acetyltransferase [Flavitalea sp.]
MKLHGYKVRIANKDDEKFASEISMETKRSAIARGSGIANRSPDLIIQKMRAGRAVVAVTGDGRWAGFSYVEPWANGEFVSNSGMIVSPEFRKGGVAGAIKRKIFALSRKLFPKSKIFSITTGFAIMKMNAKLAFETVTFEQLPHESAFWEGCSSCIHYNLLNSQNRKNCLCTAMLFTPAIIKNK